MINTNKYDHIIADGFGTLFDHNLDPLPGALMFITNNKNLTLFSNIGSMTGDLLRSKLEKKFELLPKNIITSLDLTIKKLKELNLKEISHFGGINAQEALESNFNLTCNYNAEALVMTSLPNQNYIESCQNALNFFLNENKKIILANPDRITPEPPFKITVAMFFDIFLNQAEKIKKTVGSMEIGKPILSLSDLNIDESSSILVIGDNPDTDTELGNYLNCDSILISKNMHSIPAPTFIVEGLDKIENF